MLETMINLNLLIGSIDLSSILEPEFVQEAPINITVQEGRYARLSCTVTNLDRYKVRSIYALSKKSIDP